MPEEESIPLFEKYEITFVVDEEATSEKVEKVLTSHEASVEKTSDVGKKQFTHPLGKKTSGHYFAIMFTAQRDKLPQIESDLKGDKTLIRYLIIKALRRPLEMPKREGTEATRKRTEKVIITKDQQDMAPESKKPAPSKEVEADEDKKEPEVKVTPYVNPVRDNGRFAVDTGGIKPPVSEATSNRRQESTAFSNGVKAPEVPSKEDEIKSETASVEVTDDKKPGIKPVATKKAAPAKKIEKAEKLSAAELDKKLEELVKE